MSSASEGRYGAIERAYGEGQFSGALERAEALLTELNRPDAPPKTQAVLGRLQLLTGHIHLYGLGQPDEARAHYQAVARSTAPTTLVELAQAGLKRCEEQPAASTAPAANTQASSPVTPGDLELPATPWLSLLSEPQEALTALQTAWREVPASGHAAPTGRHACHPLGDRHNGKRGNQRLTSRATRRPFPDRRGWRGHLRNEEGASTPR